MIDLQNISDEALAAYMDGNATFDEIQQISEALAGNDVILMEVLDIAEDSTTFMSEMMSGNMDWNMNDDTGFPLSEGWMQPTEVVETSFLLENESMDSLQSFEYSESEEYLTLDSTHDCESFNLL